MAEKRTATELPAFEPKVIDLAGLADYQEGAVVSRTLLDRPTGTITFFAFADGQGLSEHTAPFDALVQVLEGRVEVTIGGRPFQLTAGQMILMPANMPHALKALARFKMLLIMVKEAR